MIQQWKPSDDEQEEVVGDRYPSDTLDLNAVNTKTSAISTYGRRSAAFQLVQATGTWSSAVVEVVGSIDGTNWVDLGGTDISAVGLTGLHDVSHVAYVRLNVKTAEGSTNTVVVSAWLTTAPAA